MKCRSCGAEIADKALVCYRCGVSTTEPKFKAPAPRAARSPLTLLVILVAVAVIGAFAWYARSGDIGTSPTLRWLIVAFAVVLVVLRGVARRARR